MNEHKNIITIEDEIKEFSDKPVKSSALYKKVKDLESGAVPDSSSANVGDVLTKGEDGIGWSAPSGGGGGIRFIDLDTIPARVETVGGISFDSSRDDLIYYDDNTRVVLHTGEYIFIDNPSVDSMYAFTRDNIVLFGKCNQLEGASTPPPPAAETNAVALAGNTPLIYVSHYDGELYLIPSSAQLVLTDDR